MSTLRQQSGRARLGLLVAGLLACSWFVRGWFAVVAPSGPVVDPPDARPAATPLAEHTATAPADAASRQAVAEAGVLPAAASAPLADRDWWESVRDVPAGELQVLVLREAVGEAGARLTVWPAVDGAIEAATGDGALAVARGATDGDGRACFGLPAGDYVLQAEADCGCVLGGGTVTAAGFGRTVVLLLGSSRIHGRVCDVAGAPCIGQRVRVVGIGPLPARTSVAATDGEGRYEVAGLAHGRYHVQVDDPTVGDLLARERMVTVAAGASARMDFGRTGPRQWLSGQCIDGFGDAVPGVRLLALRERDHGDERRVRCDADGAFAVELPVGTWQVFQADEASGTPACLAEIAAVPVSIAVPLPGIRVVVQIDPQFAAAVAGGGLRLRDAAGFVAPDLVFDALQVTYAQWLGRPPGPATLVVDGDLRLGGPDPLRWDLRLAAERLVEHVRLPLVWRSR